MGNYTKNLNLYKTDMSTDGNDTFNFDRDLNENWEKIDDAIEGLNNGSGGDPLLSYRTFDHEFGFKQA